VLLEQAAELLEVDDRLRSVARSSTIGVRHAVRTLSVTLAR
jgi:hypothetical protein